MTAYNFDTISNFLPNDYRLFTSPLLTTKPKSKAPQPGDKVRVTVEGIVADPKDLPAGSRDLHYIASAEGFSLYMPDRRATNVVVTIKAPPKWVTGDVVQIRYGSKSYTYVRGVKQWPGEYAGPLSDGSVDTAWRDGRVRHLLRDGSPIF